MAAAEPRNMKFLLERDAGWALNSQPGGGARERKWRSGARAGAVATICGEGETAFGAPRTGRSGVSPLPACRPKQIGQIPSTASPLWWSVETAGTPPLAQA